MKKPKTYPPMVFKKHAPKPHPTMSLIRYKKSWIKRGQAPTMVLANNIIRDRGGL